MKRTQNSDRVETDMKCSVVGYCTPLPGWMLDVWFGARMMWESSANGGLLKEAVSGMLWERRVRDVW